MKRDSNCFDPNSAVYFSSGCIMTVLIQIQSRVQMTVQMCSIKDAIMYRLRKASYKDVQDHQQRGLLLWKEGFFLFLFLYFDSSRRHTRDDKKETQIIRAKMMSLDAIFSRGNKLSSGSLTRFCCRKHKNSTAHTSRS